MTYLSAIRLFRMVVRSLGQARRLRRHAKIADFSGAGPKVITPLVSGRSSGEEDTMPEPEITNRLSTGIAGLDEVLHGGLLPHRSYLVRGTAGTGKTTLGLHFLTAGAANGEKSLLITLGTPEARICLDAEILGFDLTGIPIIDLTPAPDFFTKAKTYDI